MHSYGKIKNVYAVYAQYLQGARIVATFETHEKAMEFCKECKEYADKLWEWYCNNDLGFRGHPLDPMFDVRYNTGIVYSVITICHYNV